MCFSQNSMARAPCCAPGTDSNECGHGDCSAWLNERHGDGLRKGEEEEHCEAQTAKLLGTMLSVSSLALHGRQGWGKGPCTIPTAPGVLASSGVLGAALTSQRLDVQRH